MLDPRACTLYTLERELVLRTRRAFCLFCVSPSPQEFEWVWGFVWLEEG